MRPKDLTDEQTACIAKAISCCTHRLNSRGAADLRQDLWLHILEKLPTYDPARAKLVTWAGRMAQWRLLTLIAPPKAKKRQGHVRPLLDDLNGHPALQVKPVDLAARHLARDIAKILTGSRRERLAWRLLSVGFNCTQVARVVGVSPSRVSQYRRLWRKRLVERALEGLGDD